MTVYIVPSAWEEWANILKELFPESVTKETQFNPGDIFIGTLEEEDSAWALGLKCHSPESLHGSELSALIEEVHPLLDVSRELLELAWRGLNDPERGWDSIEEVTSLFRFARALWAANIPFADREWLRLAELAHHFGFTRVQVPDDKAGTLRPMFEAMGYDKWSDFSVDILGMRAESSSQMKWIWEVYAVRLKMTAEEMIRIGKAKLASASNALRKATEDPQDNERVSELLTLVCDPETSFAELNDKLRADRGGGTVALIRRDEIDWALVAGWLKTKPLPEQILVDANIDGEHFESALVIIINPAILPDDAAKIRTRMGASLRWDRRIESGG